MESSPKIQSTENYSSQFDAKPEFRVDNIWRVPRIVSAPEKITEPQDLIDFYFQAEKGDQIAQISDLARDLELDLQRPLTEVPINLSRAVVLLIKTRNVLREYDNDSEVEESLHLINIALGKYIENAEPYVFSIVKRYSSKNHSYTDEDLMSAGQIGLIKGLETFNLSLDEDHNPLKWSFFRIRKSARYELNRHGRIIRLNQDDIDQIKNKSGDNLSDEDKKLLEEAELRVARADVMSLDVPLKNDTETTYGDMVPDEYSTDEKVDELDIENMLSELDERDQQIARMRFGFEPYGNKYGGYTFQEIADTLGITIGRVSTIISRKIVPKLKKLKGFDNLIEFEELSKIYPRNEIAAEMMTEKEYIILSMLSEGLTYTEIADKINLSDSSVHGYIKKINIIFEVNRKELAVVSAIENNILQINPPHRSSIPHLFGRSSEVLEFIRKGFSNKEIATALSISEETSKEHVKQLFKILRVKNRPHAIRIAYENGLFG